MPHPLTRSRLRRIILMTACCAAGSLMPAAAQSPATPACVLRGSVATAETALPGVAVFLKQGEQLVASTSTGDDGRWQAEVAFGLYQVTFDLRGFRTVELERSADTAGCHDTLDVSMEIDHAGASGNRPPLVFAADATLPSDGSAPAASTTLIRGKDASLNRAVLRERAAALARGEFSVSAETQRGASLTESGTERPAGSTTPILSASLRGSPVIVGAPSAQQRAPRLPTVPLQRLLSATSSYTVAGSALDSAPYQLRSGSASTKPGYLRQSVDFTLGGPLPIPGVSSTPSKTNATLSYSAIRGGNLFDQYATLPTAAMRNGDLSASAPALRDPLTGLPFENGTIPADRLNPTALSLLALLPLPNGDGTSRNFHYTSTSRSTQDSLNLRLTRPLGGTAAVTRTARGGRPAPSAVFSATLNGQIEFRRNVNDRLNALPAIAGVGRSTNLRVPVSLNVTRRGTQHSASITYSRSTNETTNRYAGVRDVAGLAGIVGASSEPFAWGIPTLSFATLTSVNDLTPTERTDQRLGLGYAWSRSVRTHRVRLGADFGESRAASRSDANARGSFVFTGLYSGSDFGDFLLGQPQQASVQYGPGVVDLTSRLLSLYVQDDWRRWSSVTINAGVRYELVTPFQDQAGRLANLDAAPGFTAVTPVLSGGVGSYSGAFPAALVQTDTDNIAPRIGAAWRLASRTTLRAGYGVSFNTGSYNTIARQLSGQPPFAVTSTAIGTATQPLHLATALSNSTSGTTNSFGVARDYEAGVIRTWTLDLNRDMGDAWNISAGLTRSSGSNLDIIRAPNRGPSGLRFADAPPFLWQTSEGRSRLHSATFRLRRWYVRGISTSIDYTMARSMDDASTIGGGATVVAQDEQNLAAEWGTSSFSRRHQLSGDLNFELPFGEGNRWLNDGGPWAMLLERWSAYVTFAAQTGTPLTARVLSNAADVARGTNGTLRADLTGMPIGSSTPSADRFFNTAAFALPSAGTFGSAGRNLIVGPGSRDLHLQMTRDIPVGGTRTLSIQLRVNNILNLVNYSSVDTVVNSPTFGQVTSVRPLRSTQLNVRWRF